MRVMTEAHEKTESGNLGVKKTYERIRREYYWPEMWHDVSNFVKECGLCQRHKVAQTVPQGLMGQRLVEKPFPRSKNQY